MMDECKFIDGNLNQCGNSSRYLKLGKMNNKRTLDIGNFVILVYYCPFCGADIMEPEPKPDQMIIKKSGETWVCRFNGVDYLWANTGKLDKNAEAVMVRASGLLRKYWIPIEELAITDEIAKLRPAVVNIHSNENYTLLGIIKTSSSVYSERFGKLSYIDTYVTRLSTIDDLP